MSYLILNKFRGLNNKDTEYNLNKVFLTEAQNVIIENDGTLKTREGETQIIAMDKPHSLYVSEQNICLFRQSSKLYRLKEDFTAEGLYDDIPNTLPMHYLSLNDKIYMTDGETELIYDEGKIRKWGVETPTPPTLEETNGFLPIGAYRVCLSYANQYGEEGGISRYNEITISESKGILITTPVIPNGYSCNIYITPPNSGRFYFYQYITEAGMIAYTNNNLTGITPLTEGYLKPPFIKHLAFFESSIVGASANILYFSRPFAYHLFDLVHDFVPFPDYIVGIKKLGGFLYIGTVKGLFVLDTNRVLRKVLNKRILANSMKIVDGAFLPAELGIFSKVLLFATSDGVYAGTSSGGIIPLTIKQYSFGNHTGGSSALFNENKYLLILN